MAKKYIFDFKLFTFDGMLRIYHFQGYQNMSSFSPVCFDFLGSIKLQKSICLLSSLMLNYNMDWIGLSKRVRIRSGKKMIQKKQKRITFLLKGVYLRWKVF